MKIKRYTVFIVVIMFCVHAKAQSADPKMIAECQARLVAFELSNHINLCRKEDNPYLPPFPLKQKDTLFYKSGKVFRTLESSDELLTGKYQLFYRSGSIRSVAYFKNYIPVDSAINYYPDGKIKSKMIFEKKDQFKVFRHYENGKIKQELKLNRAPGCIEIEDEYIKIDEASKVTYFDKSGTETNRKEYLRLNPEEK